MERVNTVPLSKADNFFLFTHMASLCFVIAVCVQAFSEIFLGKDIPTYLYLLELALPAFMLAYHARKHHYFKSWKRSHEEIARILGMTEYYYFKKSFREKQQKNYFELMLVAEEGFGFNIEGQSINQLEGRVLSEAKELAEQAKKRLESVRRAANVAGQAELYPEDAKLVRSKLLTGEFEAAYQAISDGARKKTEAEAEVRRIKEQAQQARCLPVLINEFEDKNFDPEEARVLILTAKRVCNQAKEFGIEKEAIAELENGDLEGAKRMIVAAREKKWLESSKKSAISTLKRRIDKLEGVPGQQSLLEKLDELKGLEYDSRPWRIAHHDLKDQILRAEISKQK